MRLIRESVSLFCLSGELNPTHQEPIARYIESCGRECYKSSHKIEPGSAYKFISNMTASGHLSMAEHFSISAKILTNRGVSLEIVRHRVAAYSQESTRYCNYSADRFGNELTFIIPVWVTDEKIEKFNTLDFGGVLSNEILTDPDYIWYDSLRYIEEFYFELLDKGWTPEKAREVLPNSLSTTIVATYNLRQWRHVLNQRLDRKCHPQMRYLMLLIAEKFLDSIPIFFEDIVTRNQLLEIKNELSRGQ